MSTKAIEFATKPVVKCLRCGGRMRPASGELVFERNGLVVTVTDVPVSACDDCGERYVPGPVGVAISDAVDDFLRYFETKATADAVARPRSLVLKADERAALAFAT